MNIVKTNIEAINRENFLIAQKPKPLPKFTGTKAHEQFNLATSLLWEPLHGCYGKKWNPEKKLKFLRTKLHEEVISAKSFVEFAWVIHELKERKAKINNVLTLEGYEKVKESIMNKTITNLDEALNVLHGIEDGAYEGSLIKLIIEVSE